MNTTLPRASFRAARSSVVVRAAVAIPAPYKAVKPIGDRVLVKVDKEEEKTAGGILLPSSAQKKPTAGAIVQAASTVTTVKAGDRVVYSKYAGTDVDITGEEHVLLKVEDVIATLPLGAKVDSMKPLSDRVLVKQVSAQTQTSGGVLLTTESADKPTIGEVLAVGAGKEDSETKEVVKVNVAVGSSVLYSKYSGTEFEEDDQKYIVIREGDILAVLS